MLSRLQLVEAVVTILLLVLIPYILKRLLNLWRLEKAFSKLPYDSEGSVFLLGQGPRLLRDPAAFLDSMASWTVEKKWKCARNNIGPGYDRLIALHPETAKLVLQKDPKDDEIYHYLMPWLGEGLLVANGPRWARSRRLLTPAFHFDIIKSYIPIYADAAKVMVKRWAQVPEGQSFDVFPYISLLTLDVVLRCACSHESHCQENGTHNSYISAVYELSDLFNKRLFFFPAHFDWFYALTPNGWRFKRACNLVHKFSKEVIQTRRAILEEKKRKGEEVLKGTKKKYLDFIDILLEARDENGVGLTDEEIRAEVDTFMFEGHDTTASGIVWALYNLAKYPDHQEKCRQEVDELFDQKDVLELDDVKTLKYLKYCIKESLRLFPPVPATGRCLEQPTEIGGHKMPKGTCIISQNYAVHHNPDVWEDPEEFNPLRFTEENSKGRSPHAFIAFSAGPRNCIGQEFALNEEKVVIAHILRNFELTLDTEKPVKKDFLIILRPKDGLYLKLKHRKCSE